jgi:hypothetical protein
MILMAVTGVVLVAGIVLTLWWGGTGYETWEPRPDGAEGTSGSSAPGRRASVHNNALRYLRGVAIALVGGFWVGALVTGPFVRLIMRLLAVTAGDEAQGRLTEAEEVIGSIDVGGTIGLIVFGGILPGLLSGAIYVVFRRWLPSGRPGGVVFGALHLVIAATRIDPLRPDNPDFDILGPGWLAVAAFGLASVVHGMAVVAIANRYSHHFPPAASTPAERARAFVPLGVAALVLTPGLPFILAIVAAGLVITIAASRLEPVVAFVRSGGALVGGRIAVLLLVVAMLPGSIADVHDVIVRDDVTAGSPPRG